MNIPVMAATDADADEEIQHGKHFQKQAVIENQRVPAVVEPWHRAGGSRRKERSKKKSLMASMVKASCDNEGLCQGCGSCPSEGISDGATKEVWCTQCWLTRDFTRERCLTAAEAQRRFRPFHVSNAPLA